MVSFIVGAMVGGGAVALVICGVLVARAAYKKGQMEDNDLTLLTADEQADLLNLINDMLEGADINLEVAGYEDYYGVFFTVNLIRKWEEK